MIDGWRDGWIDGRMAHTHIHNNVHTHAQKHVCKHTQTHTTFSSMLAMVTEAATETRRGRRFLGDGGAAAAAGRGLVLPGTEEWNSLYMACISASTPRTRWGFTAMTIMSEFMTTSLLNVVTVAPSSCT